jgi:putative transcriptional regulator
LPVACLLKKSLKGLALVNIELVLWVIQMKLKCRLKEILVSRGMKQNFVCEKTGLSKTSMSGIVNNKTIPTLPVAYKIAKVLDLKIEEIWNEDNE